MVFIVPTSPADRGSIKTLLQQCLTAQGQAVTAYEAKIDDSVARLYSLSDREVVMA
ncbi:hypothetical protein [Trichothermofontia sp.]